MARLLRWAGIGLLVLLVAIQFVPVWARQTNPPVQAEPAWNSPQTRELAKRACFDCHSNETTWPIYSKVAPVSWFVTNHVVEGREKLNFSEWGAPRANGRRRADSDDIAEVIEKGEMPLRSYVLLHPEAKLTPAEQQQLIDGLQASLR